MRQALPVDLHLSVESIVEQQVVGHPHAVGLHRVTLRNIVLKRRPALNFTLEKLVATCP